MKSLEFYGVTSMGLVLCFQGCFLIIFSMQRGRRGGREASRKLNFSALLAVKGS